jgi:hypothetical protein
MERPEAAIDLGAVPLGENKRIGGQWDFVLRKVEVIRLTQPYPKRR